MNPLSEDTSVHKIDCAYIFEAVKDGRLHERPNGLGRAPHGKTPLIVIGEKGKEKHDADWTDEHHR